MSVEHSLLPPQVVPLQELVPGATCRIWGFGGGGLRARLFGLGIRPGAVLTVVRGRAKGPRVLRLGTKEVLIGGPVLGSIFVTKES